MEQIKFIVRLSLLFLSCYGYLQQLRRYIHLDLCIGVLFSMIGSVMFLAGILNLLPEIALILFLFGLILTGFSIRRKDRISDVLSFGTVIFLASAVFFLFLLRGSKFAHEDNFNHWAIISQILVQKGRFPNYSDGDLLFPSYPTGSASFIFFITKILRNRTEWAQLYAQAILMTGMLVSLFAFAKNRLQALTVAICGAFLLCSNISFYDLLVDTLLPVVALSAMSVCIFYGRDLGKKVCLLIPYSIFLISIKNSGIIFILLLYGYAWFALRKQFIPAKTWLTLLAAPALSLLLWQKHVELVFDSGMMGKHSVSVSYYLSVFREKDFPVIASICAKTAEKVFSFSNPALWTLFLAFLLWFILKHFTSQPCRKMKDTVLFAAASYVLYQLGTLGMYLFSMPVNEAMMLAGYGRYHRTILIFVVGLVLIGAMQGLSGMRWRSRERNLQIGVAAAILVLSCLAVSPRFGYYQRQHPEGTIRYQFEQTIAQYDISAGANYLILLGKNHDNDGFIYRLCLYLLSPESVQLHLGKDLEDIDLSGIDYIIAFEKTDETEAFLAKLSPDAAPVVRLH